MPKRMSSQWSAIRGFNYQPSHSSHLQYTWTNFSAACWEREVPWALRFGSNTLRVWLDWSAWLAIGEEMLDHLEEALVILDKHHLRMIPVLFNRWTDARFPAGGIADQDLRSGSCDKFYPYIDALTGRFGGDSRIVLWDLANEPQAPGPNPEMAFLELRWLCAMAARLRINSRIPLTIGTMTGENVATYAPLVDVISFHPYTRLKDEMEARCEEHLLLAAQLGKPLLCTETCIGSLDDEERGRLAHDALTTLERYQIGWLAWQLVSGEFVTGSRERTDNNAVRPGEGFMPFVLENGATRPGHEWLVRRNQSGDVGSQTVSVIRPPYKTRD